MLLGVLLEGQGGVWEGVVLAGSSGWPAGHGGVNPGSLPFPLAGQAASFTLKVAWLPLGYPQLWGSKPGIAITHPASGS